MEKNSVMTLLCSWSLYYAISHFVDNVKNDHKQLKSCKFLRFWISRILTFLIWKTNIIFIESCPEFRPNTKLSVLKILTRKSLWQTPNITVNFGFEIAFIFAFIDIITIGHKQSTLSKNIPKLTSQSLFFGIF